MVLFFGPEETAAAVVVVAAVGVVVVVGIEPPPESFVLLTWRNLLSLLDIAIVAAVPGGAGCCCCTKEWTCVRMERAMLVTLLGIQTWIEHGTRPTTRKNCFVSTLVVVVVVAVGNTRQKTNPIGVARKNQTTRVIHATIVAADTNGFAVVVVVAVEVRIRWKKIHDS